LGPRQKCGHFFKQHFSNKNKCWGPKSGIFSPFETTKKGVKKALAGVYIGKWVKQCLNPSILNGNDREKYVLGR
jgi:homoserine trans-succinylase